MATKRGKRTTKKVKSLRSKGLSAAKAKRVRGGSLSPGLKPGAAQKLPSRSVDYSKI
jgi:hypothetical protein